MNVIAITKPHQRWGCSTVLVEFEVSELSSLMRVDTTDIQPGKEIDLKRFRERVEELEKREREIEYFYNALTTVHDRIAVRQEAANQPAA